MSLMIKGMKITECCCGCPCHDSEFEVCNLDKFLDIGYEEYFEKRPKDCLLVEIPTPHGRLIDADKLHSILLDMWQSDCNQSFIDAIREVGGMPTIIEAEE